MKADSQRNMKQSDIQRWRKKEKKNNNNNSNNKGHGIRKQEEITFNL